MQQFIHIIQACLACTMEIYPDFEILKQWMTGLAIFILLLELIQICHHPKAYLSNIFNYLEISANSLVIYRYFSHLGNIVWIMLFLLNLKAILTLQIFEAQRTLIKMIVQCIYGMIPFLVIVSLSVLTFAIVNLSVDRVENGSNEAKFFFNLLTQYRVLFGENPEIDFTYD